MRSHRKFNSTISSYIKKKKKKYNNTTTPLSLPPSLYLLCTEIVYIVEKRVHSYKVKFVLPVDKERT